MFSPVANHGSQKQQTCLLLESVEIDRIMSSFGDGKPELGRLELRSRLLQVKSCPAIFLCDLSSSRFCTKNTWSVNPCSLINVRNLIEISKNNCKLCKEMKGMNYSICIGKCRVIMAIIPYICGGSFFDRTQAGSSLGDDHFKQISRGQQENRTDLCSTCFVDHGNLVCNTN